MMRPMSAPDASPGARHLGAMGSGPSRNAGGVWRSMVQACPRSRCEHVARRARIMVTMIALTVSNVWRATKMEETPGRLIGRFSFRSSFCTLTERCERGRH